MKQMLWDSRRPGFGFDSPVCISFPPHYDKNPRVKLNMNTPLFFRGSENAFFIKKRSHASHYEAEGGMERVPPFISSSWTFPEVGIWTKCSFVRPI